MRYLVPKSYSSQALYPYVIWIRIVNSAKIACSIEPFRFSITHLPEDLDLDLQHSLGPINLPPNCFFLIKTNQPRKEKIAALEIACEKL